MKNANNDLPPEFQAFASLLDAQPPEVQNVFQFLIATAMHEAGKFELLNVAEVDDRWDYTFKSSAGDVFSVVRPEMSNVITWIVANALHTTATYVGFQYGASINPNSLNSKARISIILL